KSLIDFQHLQLACHWMVWTKSDPLNLPGANTLRPKIVLVRCPSCSSAARHPARVGFGPAFFRASRSSMKLSQRVRISVDAGSSGRMPGSPASVVIFEHVSHPG